MLYSVSQILWNLCIYQCNESFCQSYERGTGSHFIEEATEVSKIGQIGRVDESSSWIQIQKVSSRAYALNLVFFNTVSAVFKLWKKDKGIIHSGEFPEKVITLFQRSKKQRGRGTL